MNPRIAQALAALPPRQLKLLATGVVLIAAALAWSVGLRAPLAAYRLQSQTLATLQAQATAVPAPTPAAAAHPAAPASAVRQPTVAPAPLALIAAVSASAARAGVAVSSAAQGAQYQLADLRVHTLDIAASGSYGAILDWLADIEASQPAVGIIQLSLQPDNSGDRRSIKLQLAIYDTGEAP